MLLVAWSVGVQAEDRLNISVIPVYVLVGTSAQTDEDYDVQWDYMVADEPETLVTVHMALKLLGVHPDEYAVSWDATKAETVKCFPPNTLLPFSCEHELMGLISDWPRFAIDLHEHVPMSKLELHVLIFPSKHFAWNNEQFGTAATWNWALDRTEHHWTYTSCRAWAVHDLIVVTHELGHCFGLIHNEEDSDINLDLMHSYRTLYDWLKDSNANIVQHHFRETSPLLRTGMRPQVELHY